MEMRIILFLILFFIQTSNGGLREGGNHVQKDEWYVKSRYYTRCNWYSWSKCTRYRSAYRSRLRCEDGWTRRYFFERECNYAICDGKTDYTGACNLYYHNDYHIFRGDRIPKRSSGGNCKSPNTCEKCNDGFYIDGPYCRICSPITNCNHRRCEKSYDQICVYCEGEVTPDPYWRAYTRDIDGGKTCQKACSWRSDSTRCYPGTCQQELASKCQCVENFGGTHCEKILDSPAIEMNHAAFYDLQKIEKLENNPNYVEDDKPIHWTNFVGYKIIETIMTAKYLQPSETGIRDDRHYVRDFRVGLVEQKIVLSFYKAGTFHSSQIKFCKGMSQDYPVDHKECSYDTILEAFPPTRHDDKIIFSVSAKNGGYVVVNNRETGRDIRYYYEGSTRIREFEFHWDLVEPYHCSVTKGTSCSAFVSVNNDITDNPTITMTWGGWEDALAGLDYYLFSVYELEHDANNLIDGRNKVIGTIRKETTDSSTTFTVSEPGTYSIHFTTFDKAGNYKTGRGLFLFDDQSVVDKLENKQTMCSSASQNTSHEWVVTETNDVKISFTDRFINSRHVNNRWMNQVKTFAPSREISIYEDLYGNRKNTAIDHVHAIVDFKVSYEVHGPSLKESRPLTSVSNIHNQYDILPLHWVDGDRLRTTVKAIDILGQSNEDTITVYRDATPPIIEDLWLTRGDRFNVSVHRLEDLTEMIIEWKSYDHHSGLDSVSWQIYDQYGGTVVLHGHEDILAQGETNTLEECESKYGSYARGGNCYCTNFKGCYHQHFQVKPEIKAHGGLILNKDKGVHDYDYHLNITVISKAKLITTLIKKGVGSIRIDTSEMRQCYYYFQITIDISPPHSGVVHDGLKGNTEIDYQQRLVLNAYWDQFFDRESGVDFYQYIVGSSCAEQSDFDLQHTHPNITETYNTYGSHMGMSEGTYYFTVVAYNRALEPSEPVCTDGVTIDTSVPGVKEVVVQDARITGGLVTDTSETDYFILASDRMRRLIPNPTADCVSKATVLTDLEFYPVEKFANGTMVEVNGSIFCSNSSGAPSNIGIIIAKSSLIELAWEPVDTPGKIYDYEVGFATTPESTAPDLMYFESTKQHAHHRVMHGNIQDGVKFYVIIKTISKSNVQGLTSIGPCYVDTTPPDFTGTIDLSLSGNFLVASWPANAFIDSEEFFELVYEFSIGHKEYGIDVQNYRPLQVGGSCSLSTPPTCTAADIGKLDWYLHGHHTYYINIKVTNTAGLVTIKPSRPYIHDVQLPAEGVVLDINTQNFTRTIPFKDIEETDFQTDTTNLAARWSGFALPHLNVTYDISIGSVKGGDDIVSNKNVGTELVHKESGLSLQPFKKYYFTVNAVTSVGNTSVSSDGVTIVTENAALPGVKIYDGQPCNMTDISVQHHEEDHRFYCADDIDTQMSLNSIKSYWTVPEDLQPYTPDAFIAIERRFPYGNSWNLYRDYEYIFNVFEISINDLTLSPGIMYRVVLKLCARTICFHPIRTDGVMVMANPPVTGGITVKHLNMTEGGGNEKLLVTFDQFYDPDIENTTEKYDAVDMYEYSVTDDSVMGKLYMSWTMLTNFTVINNKISFEVVLTGEMDFSRCKRFSLRGYNKAKLYTVVSREIKYCKAFNPILINPNTIIDAVGEPGDLDGVGNPIFHTQNDLWEEPDRDYTPYKNIISAVWPSFRQRSYNYSVLNAKTIDVTTYYRQVGQLELRDPCSHPDALKCGYTVNEYVNVKFSEGELVHGTRYTVCVHANPAEIKKETWTAIIPEANSCSDGIIVDFTPPSKGNVWIGNVPTVTYQTVNTDMYVNWDGFHDIEEYNNGPHSTGIKEYILGIGTTAGGNDVYPFENVGVVQHKALHGLNLQNGYLYYATIKAVDFANRQTVVTSDPVTVDMTPPVRSDSPITITNRLITSTSEIEACWKSVFLDMESGIDYYLWGIGSEPGYTDMMSYLKVVDEECGITDKNNPLDLLDGHYYYINIRAFNKAGLSSLATSWAYQVDTTPPTGGHVYDGDKTRLKSSIKDIDYQTETKFLYAFWEGFHDSHSAIQEYYASVGTCPECEDILMEQAIGITKEFTLQDIHLGTGLKYYTTVTACNTGLLCTSVTSDGVLIDNSPPTLGVVQDGTGLYDIAYQSMTTYISAKWHGFTDAQSGLLKYVWTAGTSQGGDDIVSPRELHLTEIASISDPSLNLPINKKIFITVHAYNMAGLWTESSSNGFLVDNTAPTISSPLTFPENFGVKGLTQIYRTSMKVEWSVGDPESYIKRQYLSISSHIGGEFNLSSVKINGIARSYVFTGLQLHDGVKYYVTLISCNGAEICVNTTSDGMLVDSSPPSRGMFAINTDHASNPDLSRHSDGWMMWSSNALYLAWLGFSDVHSGINHYRVTAGSSYMADDVGQNPSQKYFHTESNTDHGDEGKVQLFTVDTISLINYDTLFVTVWAINGVGLRSHMIHSAFRRVPGGALDLIRRCDALSCDGHCVCAPQDQKCPYSVTLGSCNDTTTGNSNSLLLVSDTNGYTTTDLNFTSSDNILHGKWIISQYQGLSPLWYEWSVGYTGFSTPSGVYNILEDKVWQDGGQLMDAVFTAEKDKTLQNDVSYTFYVRAWYTTNTYAIFKSDGIGILTKAAVVQNIVGRTVTEKLPGRTVRDEDYVLIGRPLAVDWSGKFLEAATTIEKFKIYISTYPGGHDIWTGSEDIPGTVISYNISRLNLSPGIMYYTNVIAYNYAGLHRTVSSDGFIVDHLKPTSGIVYDGLERLDIEYQNSSNIVAAHWHGFIDTESGIQKYHWCVGATLDQSECSIMNWTDIGLHVSVSRKLSTNIALGTKVYSKVFATDNVGLKSETVISDGVVIDYAAPIPEKFIHTDHNLVANPSFENFGRSRLAWDNVNSTDICTSGDTFHPLSWQQGQTTCLAVVYSSSNLAKDGSSFLLIKGSISQQLEGIKTGKLYKISIFTSHLPIWDSVAANKEAFLQFGDLRKIFLIYTKPYRRDEHGVNTREEISWHRHTFYLRADEDQFNLTIGSIGEKTGIFMDDLSVQEVNLTNNDTSGHVTGHVVYLHEWGSIHGFWSFVDPESPIIDFTWAIGYAEGGTQIQPFKTEGLKNFGYNNNVTLVHNNYIYITVIATNAAGLRGVSYSDPILVDLTPPDIKFVYDGTGTDEDSRMINEVSVNWAVEDLESGVKSCKWAIGYQPGRTDLQIYTDVTGTTVSREFDESLLEGRTIYTSISCENNAGLSTTQSSDGVKISNQPPSTDNAVVQVMSEQASEYNPSYGYQGLTDNVRVKWTGFTDNIGVGSYLVNFNDSHIDYIIFPVEQDTLYAYYYNMSLKKDLTYTLSVKCLNPAFLRSRAVLRNLTVSLEKPEVDVSKTMIVIWAANKFTVSWNNMFSSKHPLYFEVSAGTYPEGVNILQWQYTNQTSVTFGLPAAVEIESGLKVHLTLHAVSAGGFYDVAKGSVILP